MTFDADERSAAGSRPIDLYTFAAPSGTYYLTSHVVDVEFDGVVFTADTMDRGDQQVAQDLTGRELVVNLPIAHPIVQRYAAFGIPERELLITLQRLQETSGTAEQEWQGFGNGIEVNGRFAAIRVPSITDDAMKVRLPQVRAQRLCNHMLFDRQCQLNRNDFKIDTFIIEIETNLTELIIGSIGGHPDHFADPAGELLHVASGERRQIIAQVGTILDINLPIVGMLPGDSITVFASCLHTLDDCLNKFNNVVNFGGMPELNDAINPRVPPGTGIIIQQ